MKKKKLQLKELKVKSFVTNLENTEMKNAKGGVKAEDEGRAIKMSNNHLPWNIRVHAWTISEIRNDGRPYKNIEKSDV
jgi:hypothetical protein